ncbi:protein spinster homolog 3 [Electrophorus electricus]|uniref:Major facilitator superfamily (MFS) profile domain-containing protein n=1 Tax=Electrophorus electricus TaxID=8005 RepID=A0A4W4FYF9_ELEEL|nr:protein spinster homolog 3 [Electrophorus electricus]XP_035383478.1 protein spinster homolog 3 [Electrophorus electricus]XP_035383479.1 protein spinster homolog 3 [Electrophorus electricus]
MEDTSPIVTIQPSEDKHPCSSQKYGSVSHETAEGDIPSADAGIKSSKRAYVAVAVLCYVNLLNYMDRYTIAGVLPSIQNYFRITDSTSGLLQTVFICSFMLLAPAFGYLGDRYNRKVIMVAGMIAWIVTTLGSSFITEEYFWVLVLMRALVGTGEASYCTIAPTIIGDLFIGSQRSIMISFFYIFIPVGSGLGYILGSKIASVTGDWHWALRLNPILGVPGLLLLVFLMPNPPRGASEMQGSVCIEHTSYLEDVKYLLRNRSFVWSSLGVTAMAFVTGALAFWTPTFLSRARVKQGIMPPCVKEPCDPSDSLIFGVITVVTGIMGVFVGTAISRKLRDRLPSADPIICAVGMLSSSPCLFLAIVLAGTSIPVTYTFIGIGEVLLSLNWAIIADILLYVVIPTRRATAEALQIMVCHLLGDAGSPYLLGIISDVVSKLQATSLEWRFHSLEYSILICPFIGVLGGLFFLFTALYIKEDRRAAEVLAIGIPGETPTRTEGTAESV